MDIDVGIIDRIKVWHDNTGVGPAWLIDSVIVRKKHSTCRPITNIFVQRLEQISKVLYRQACEQIKKSHQRRTSSTKGNDQYLTDRRTSKFKDYDDAGNRGILRSPVIYDKANSQKKVRWDEQSLGSQDEPVSIDTQRMKNKQTIVEQKRRKDISPSQIDSGHFDHQAYWISTHNYDDKKWDIQSIEETKSFDLDESTRSLLLSDRLTINNKIKTPIQEKDDDVYEFQANHWLDKDKNNGKLEVYLTPLSMHLSTHTKDEAKSRPSDHINDSKKKHPPSTSKSSSNIRQDKYADDDSKRSSKFDLGPLERSPRSSTYLDHSPRDTFKTQLDDSRSTQRSTLKRQEESSTDKSHQHTNDRDLPSKVSREPPYHSRSSAASVVDTRSSPSYNQHSKSPRLYDEESATDKPYQRTNDRDLLSNVSREPAYHTRTSAASVVDARPSPSYNQHSKSPRLYDEESGTDKSHQRTNDRDLLSKVSREPPYHSRSSAASVVDARSSPLSNQHPKSPRPYDEESGIDKPHQRTNDRDLLSKVSREPPYHSRPSAASVLDTRSSPLSNQHPKSPRPYDEESGTDKPHQRTNDRDLLSKVSREPPYHSRPSAASVLDTRSSPLSNQHPKSPRPYDEESGTDKPHQRTNDRDLLSKVSREPPYHSRSSAASVLDTRSSPLSNQHPKSPRLYDEESGTDKSHQLTNDRDLLSKVSREPPYHSRSSAASVLDTRSSPLSNQHPKSPRLYDEESGTDKSHQRTNDRDLLSKVSREPPYHSRSSAASVLDTRSSPLSNQHPKSRRLYDEESSTDKSHQRTNDRDLLSKVSREPPYHSRSSAASVVDARSSPLSNQRSKPPRSNDEPPSPLTSNRDLSTESSVRPKSAARSTHELSSQRATRSKFDSLLIQTCFVYFFISRSSV